MTAQEAIDIMYNLACCLDKPCRRECEKCEYYVDRETLKKACYIATRSIGTIRTLDENMTMLRGEEQK